MASFKHSSLSLDRIREYEVGWISDQRRERKRGEKKKRSERREEKEERDDREK